MKLSLWILKNWLEEFKPELAIPKAYAEEMDMQQLIIIENVRLFTRLAQSDIHTIYVGTADDFFADQKRQVVCHFNSCYMYLDTEDISLVLNEILNAFYFYGLWEERLEMLISRRCTLTELLDASDEYLMNPLIVLDASDSIIAMSSVYKDIPVDDNWFELIENKATFPEKIMAFHDKSKNIFSPEEKEPFYIPPGFFPRGSYSQNLFFNREWCGICVIIEYRQILDIGILHLFKILTTFVQKWINNQIDADVIKANSAILAEAIKGDDEGFLQLERKLMIHGWEKSCEKILIKADALSQNLHTHSYLCRIFTDYSPFIYAAVIHQQIVLLCNISGILKKDLLDFIKPWLNKSVYQCGVSYEFTRLDQLVDADHQASIALDYGTRTMGSINRIENYMVPWLMDVLKKNTRAKSGHPILAVIKEYDRVYSGDFYRTLYCYLQNERNNVATAAALNIHRNTLFHRLGRMGELFDINLENPDERFYLLLSFYMQE